MSTHTPLLIWPSEPSIDVIRALDMASVSYVDYEPSVDLETANVYGAVVDGSIDLDAAFTFLRTIRKGDISFAPVLLLIGGSDLAKLDGRHDLFDDFCISPAHPSELDARFKHLLAQSGVVIDDQESISYGALSLNPLTYQATIDSVPLDLTYMEYELLKYLASNPGRVFSRELLLSNVWGYDYYGGARTVDVHVRRLRAKLGEEHSALITTVRSVGYRFGDSNWS